MSSSSRQSSAIGTFLFGSLLGLGIGSLLALLLTPTSGKGIRTWVQEKMEQCPCWKQEESPPAATEPPAEETLDNEDPYESEVGY
jgi:hypothetical protein